MSRALRALLESPLCPQEPRRTSGDIYKGEDDDYEIQQTDETQNPNHLPPRPLLLHCPRCSLPYSALSPPLSNSSLRPVAPPPPYSALSPPLVLSSVTSPSTLTNSQNWSNRPPKETILLDGCDFNHWLVMMEAPPADSTRNEIIDGYIKTLAKIVGR